MISCQLLSIAEAVIASQKLLYNIIYTLGMRPRDIISERTKAALAAKKAGGKKLGKPKGTLQKSKLDPHQEKIKELLQHGVAKSAIAKMLGTSRTNLISYIKTRGLESFKAE